MNSSVKTGLVVGLVMLVIFGATVISQFTSTPKNPDEGGPGDAPVQPLRLSTLDRKYDPFSDDPAERFFQAYHEPDSNNPAKATYWFQNVNPTPVRVTIRGVSCGSCSFFSVRAMPAKDVNECATLTAAGLFPATAFPLPNVLTAVGFAKLNPNDPGVVLDVNNREIAAEIPAAGPDGPAWGYFVLGVKINTEGPISPKSVDLGLQTPKMPGPAAVRLTTYLVGAKPFEVTPPVLKFGLLPEGTADRKLEFAYWSSIRPQTDFPPPATSVTSHEAFLSVGTPVPMTAAERQQLSDELTLTDPNKRPIPVTGGYRVPVTLKRKVPGATPPEPDIGPLETAVGVSGPPGSKADRVTVRATVTGLVTLGDGLAEAKLGDYNGQFGTSKEFKLYSDRTDLDLEVVTAESHPKFLDATLSAPTAEPGRRAWTLKIAVPAELGFGTLPPDAVVVLRSKGPTPQRVRIPVQGNGFRR